MAYPTDFAKPDTIAGGCLCGSLKYQVDFPTGHDFLKSSMTCQCTQDRRNTGSFFFPGHRVTLSGFKWVGGTSTLKEYSSSPGAFRGFCAECGSFLTWRHADGGYVTFTLGTVDPLYLFGDGAKDSDIPKDGFGFALASGSGGHEWCSNEIPGVTDVASMSYLGGIRGPRWEGSEPK